MNMSASNCLVCNEPVQTSDIRVVKAKGIQTFLLASEKRGDDEIREKLQGVNEILLHSKCYKGYTKEKSVLSAARRSTEQREKCAEQSEEPRESQPTFDFEKRCLFCGEEVVESSLKVRVSKRVKISLVKCNTSKSVILEKLKERNDDIAASIKERCNQVTDLVDVKSRYHAQCYNLVLRAPSTTTKGRPSGDVIDAAMEQIYEYVEENSSECQFLLETLLDQVTTDNIPHLKTVKAQLKKKYGDDIVIFERKKRGTVVCFKNLGYQLLCDKLYEEKEADPRQEMLRVVREAAAVIRSDIRSVYYDTDNYPAPDEFVENVKSAVPESLQVLLSEIITKNKRGSLISLERKCISIAHAIIASVRPRSFLSPLQIGVGAFLYKKYASKNLINILSNMGFSASYNEIGIFENSSIHARDREILENTFSQFVFDNADFNTDTLDGRGTFHSMGGIHCITPSTGIEKDSIIPRITRRKSAAEIAEIGRIPVIQYGKHHLAGLKATRVENVNELYSISHDILPTVPDFIWHYGKWICAVDNPGWNGFMEQVTLALPYETSKIMCVPFIHEPPSEYDTIYSTLLEAIKRGKLAKQISIFVTFDQPLFWKASDIVAAADSGSDLNNVIIRLGGFHLLMSFLGCIGSVMAGSGLKELLELLYAGNSVNKILTGHAYSRAVRAHTLTHLSLAKIILDSVDFSDDERDVLDDYTNALNRSSVLTARNDKLVKSAMDKLKNQLKKMKTRSPTSALWIQYFEMVTLVKNFLEAERCGIWELHLDTIQKMLPYFHATGHFLYAKSAHLYLQQMRNLHEKIPADEFDKFTKNGYFTIRRTEKFWSGIMSDQTIEQVLMRSLWTSGGLHHRGLSESSISSWVLGMISLQSVCEQMENFAGVMCSVSEQHVDVRPTRVIRDNTDTEKLDLWFSEHNPFPEGDNIMSISTGIIGDEKINCHRAHEIGLQMMSNICDKDFGSITFQRSKKVQTLANVNSSITIEKTRIAIDPLLLFQRMCIMKHSESDLQNHLAFDLAPFPLTLFNEEGMRKGTKSSLYSAFTPLQNVTFGEKHMRVIDGGFLLHKVVWSKCTNFQDICLKYVMYVQQNYGTNVSIVFDGYTSDLTIAGTKSAERIRRKRKQQCPDFAFDVTTVPTISQEQFLSNENNKEKFVNMLRIFFARSAIEVEQAIEDADVLIVNTALEKLTICDSVEIIGEDIDLLVLLTALAPKKSKIYFRKPAKGKTQEALFGPDSLKYSDCIRNNILFLHAFSGCDTTSCHFNVGKLKHITTLKNRQDLLSAVHLFQEKNIHQRMLVEAGELFLIALYGGSKEEKCLNTLRFKQFLKSATKTKINLALLPPSKSSATQHIMRTYHQVQTWIGNYQDPEEWGWCRTYAGLQPVPTTAAPAPEELLKLISCKCKAHCTGACGCRKAGLKCSAICYNCSGVDCTNSAQYLQRGPNLYHYFDDNDDDQEHQNDTYNDNDEIHGEHDNDGDEEDEENDVFQQGNPKRPRYL